MPAFQIYSNCQGKKMNTVNLLDDVSLIKEYIQGKNKLGFNNNLRVEPVGETIQLLTKKGVMLASVNIASQFKVVLVRQDSNYWELINKILLENSLMPTGKLVNELMRYEYHPIPRGYQINYAEANQLWQYWQRNINQNTDGTRRLNLLVFNPEGWQPIKDVGLSNETVFIKTYASDVVIHNCSRIAWLAPIRESFDSLPQKPTFVKPTVPAIVEEDTAHENLQLVVQNMLWSQAQVTKEVEQVQQPSVLNSTKNSSKTAGNVLSIDQGRLYIQTIEGEIVVEGSDLAFWFSPPEGQNIQPQPVKVK
ncbi:hypothetical protein DSM106972_018800 [Dulcicalothrix desertica PCC 7102]|uniref:Uncharacterized protein n=2 Tax=Dulcicalothrix desertica TaxID=32056 RepID=A0A433VNF2_9CYAN|nr:hypothetical protein DSM106972_018800 [Dulcicalothrix desertica PCC 7102]TWH39789.1 hypothetical protein CAL7102_09050 [Dulcicalothrix desertica PCC 7102]